MHVMCKLTYKQRSELRELFDVAKGSLPPWARGASLMLTHRCGQNRWLKREEEREGDVQLYQETVHFLNARFWEGRSEKLTDLFCLT